MNRVVAGRWLAPTARFRICLLVALLCSSCKVEMPSGFESMGFELSSAAEDAFRPSDTPVRIGSFEIGGEVVDVVAGPDSFLADPARRSLWIETSDGYYTAGSFDRSDLQTPVVRMVEVGDLPVVLVIHSTGFDAAQLPTSRVELSDLGVSLIEGWPDTLVLDGEAGSYSCAVVGSLALRCSLL